MLEQARRGLEAAASALPARTSELVGVPVDCGCGEKVQSGDAEVLGLACPVADLALESDPQGTLQADLRPTLHVGIEQPINVEERPLDPSDFAKGDGKVVPAASSRILPPIGPFSSFGAHFVSKTWSRSVGRSRMRGMKRYASSAVTAKTRSVNPPVSAYCSRIRQPVPFMSRPSAPVRCRAGR